MRNYKTILDCFIIMVGLSINYDKSAIIALNVKEEKIVSLQKCLGCLVGALPIKYLRIPLGANPKRVKT